MIFKTCLVFICIFRETTLNQPTRTMNYKRRNFVRNLGISICGIPLATQISYSSNITSLNEISNPSSIIDKIKNDGYDILLNHSFKLNDICTAIPVKKQHLLFGTEKGLLIIIDDSNCFILNEKQAEAYQDFLKNVNACSKQPYLQHCLKPEFLALSTPQKILKSNNNKDFRFKNGKGDIVEVGFQNKKKFVKIFKG